MPKSITQNTLFYGDNLRSAVYLRPIVRKHFPGKCVDLIHPDPAFTTKQDIGALGLVDISSSGDYNVITFKKRKTL